MCASAWRASLCSRCFGTHELASGLRQRCSGSPQNWHQTRLSYLSLPPALAVLTWLSRMPLNGWKTPFT